MSSNKSLINQLIEYSIELGKMQATLEFQKADPKKDLFIEKQIENLINLYKQRIEDFKSDIKIN